MIKNRQNMEQEGYPEIEILRAELEAYAEIVDSLPVDPHDMQVHFWCDPTHCYSFEDEEDEY